MRQKLRHVPEGAGMAPGTGRGDIAQRRRAKRIGVFGPVGHPHPPDIAGMAFETLGLARPDLRFAHRMEALIGLEAAGMAGRTPRRTIEQLHPGQRLGRHCGAVAQIGVKGRVIGAPFKGNEGGDGVGHIGEMDRAPGGDFRSERGKLRLIRGDRRHAGRQNVPSPAFGGDQARANGSRHIVFLIVPGHLVR